MLAEGVLFAALACCASAGRFRQEPVDWVFEEGQYVATTQTSEDGSMLTVTLSAVTEGWVGIGLNRLCSMAGADLVIAWVNAAGEGHALDLHGQDAQNGLPIVDDMNDVELVEADGSLGTIVMFVKTANPDDPGDVILQDGGTGVVIWAYGMDDPVGDMLTSEDYHGNTTRGCVEIPPGVKLFNLF